MASPFWMLCCCPPRSLQWSLRVGCTQSRSRWLAASRCSSPTSDAGASWPCWTSGPGFSTTSPPKPSPFAPNSVCVCLTSNSLDEPLAQKMIHGKLGGVVKSHNFLHSQLHRLTTSANRMSLSPRLQDHPSTKAAVSIALHAMGLAKSCSTVARGLQLLDQVRHEQDGPQQIKQFLKNFPESERAGVAEGFWRYLEAFARSPRGFPIGPPPRGAGTSRPPPRRRRAGRSLRTAPNLARNGHRRTRARRPAGLRRSSGAARSRQTNCSPAPPFRRLRAWWYCGPSARGGNRGSIRYLSVRLGGLGVNRL